jgi:hypothetical protein
MKWKSTLVLVALAVLSGLWVWKGDAWAVRMNLRPAPPAAASSASLDALAADFAPDKITHIEVTHEAGPVVLDRTSAGWKMPGDWPLRVPEAEELVQALADLRTRFQPLSAETPAAYGLAPHQKPTLVTVTASGTSYRLAFGEQPADPDAPAFTRPAFLRVNDNAEILRLGPDVLPVLKRPAEAYRKRQLFPDADRVKVAGPATPPSPFAPPPPPSTSTVALLGDKVTSIAVSGPGSTTRVLWFEFPVKDGTFTLKRTAATPTPTAPEKGGEAALTAEQIASSWELALPVRDRVDPAALRRVLAAVPELWVEEFIDPAKAKLALDHPATVAAALHVPFFGPSPADPLLLDKPQRTLAVTRADGAVLTLAIGGIARIEEREETISAPGGPPGMPPQTRTIKVPEEYRYAKIGDTTFVVKATAFADVFAKLDAIQDTRITRFDSDNVQDVVIAAKGATPIKLTRKKETDKPEKWFLDSQPAPVAADPAKVNELLGQLSALQSEGTAATAFDPQTATRVTVTAGTKTTTLLVSKADAGKLAVQVEGWPRVALVPDTVAKSLERPSHEFLDRDLLTLAAANLGTIKIATPKPEQAITLKKDDKGIWKAENATFNVDAVTVSQLTGALAPFQVKSIAGYGDAVKWADFGLEVPEFTLSVTLTGDKPATHTIKLGKPDPTGGRFARIDDGKAVAVLDVPAASALAKSKPDFIDRTLLTFDPTTLTGFARKKGAEELEIVPGAAVGWDVVKPAKQKADPVLMEQLADTLGRLRADRVVAQGPKADVFKAHGLDTPAATLTLTVGDKGDAKVLKIGSPVDVKLPDGDRHVAVEGAGTDAVVGVISADVAGKLLAAPNAFRDRTLAKFVDADKVTLERGDRKITFVKADGGWKIDGVPAEVESQELDDFVTRLTKLQAAELVADKPKADELKKFGLDKPEAKWTVSANGADVLVLLIGKKDATAQRVFAKTEKGEVVGVLPPDVSSRALAEYRRRKAWDGVDANQTESVEIKRGKASFTLAKRGPLWIDPAKPGDVVDPRAATELVAALAALKAERFAADKDADEKLFGLADPEFVITVTSRDGMKKVLHIGGAVGGVDGKQVYAKVADATRTDVFVLGEADTARLTRDRAAYLEKKEPEKK